MKNPIFKVFTLVLTIVSLCFTSLGQTTADGKPLAPGIYVEFNTNKGKILCQLEYQKTPMTVANFVGLAEGNFTVDDAKYDKPFYNGLTFHRVIKNFMIQGGDPDGNGSGGPKHRFTDEIVPELKHTGPGILSMANAGPGTNGSQFFITHLATPHLDGKHTVFGHVIEGLDVVNLIEQNDSMTTVTIIRVGDAAKKWNATKTYADANAKLKAVEDQKAAEQMKIGAMTEDQYKAYMFAEILKKFPTANQSPSGLVYIIENEGTGPKAVAGNNVSLHYKGTLRADGKQFDSSYDRKKPMDFIYKTNQMIPGFEEGIAMLAKGGKAKLIIPYYQAYGKQGRPGAIPPYSDLVFDIEMVDLSVPRDYKAEGIQFLEANKQNKDVQVTSSGLQYTVLKTGTGKKPSKTATVTVHYHGTTPDGTVFDSSVDRGETISFELLQVIKGWTEGLQLMNEGAKYKFFIPGELAYGSNPPQGGQGPIKAHMPLIFEVELFTVVDYKQDGLTFLAANKTKEGVMTTPSGLQYIVLKKGCPLHRKKKPTTASTVTVHYVGTTLDGTVFDSSIERKEPASFPLDQVIKGWTEGLQLMQKGSKFKFFIPEELAYGSNPPDGGTSVIKSQMLLVFEVELLKIENPKPVKAEKKKKDETSSKVIVD